MSLAKLQTMLVRLVVGLAMCILAPSLAQAQLGDVEVRLNGGSNVAHAGMTNIVEIWIFNDEELQGMSINFELNIGRSYNIVSGYGSFGYVNPEGDAVGAFNLVHGEQTGINNAIPDTLVIYGSGFPGSGLPPHYSHALCYTFAVYIDADAASLSDGFCIDNIFYPPAAGWTFYTASGQYAPDFQGQPNSSPSNPDAPPVCFDILAMPPRGNVDVHLNGGADVAYTGSNNIIEFWITNENNVGVLSNCYELDIGVDHEFDSTYGSLGYINPEGDMVGAFELFLGENSYIHNGPQDSIMLGGACVNDSLPAHDAPALCYTMSVYIPPDQPEVTDGFCVDNIFIPSGGGWWFTDYLGNYPPDFNQLPNTSIGEPDAPPICFDIVKGDTLWSIPGIYSKIDSLAGEEVRVFGDYVSPTDSKLVTSFSTYMRSTVMPEWSVLLVSGAEPLPHYWNGGAVIATGVLSTAVNPHPYHPGDSLLITITVSSYEYLIGGYYPVTPKAEETGSEMEQKGGHPEYGDDDCDPCKFAILLAGGVDADNNHPGYWQDLQTLYQHKTAPDTAGGENFCDSNVFVIYYEGDAPDGATIHDTLVDAATFENVEDAHHEIAARIARCAHDLGRDSEVQKLVSNHGDIGGAINLLGDEVIFAAEFADMQQELIDSCCKKLTDEMLQCFGGATIEELKWLDDQGKTEIHANSTAGESTLGWSYIDFANPYLEAKIALLRAGLSYEMAVDSAKAVYRRYLDEEVIPEIEDRIDSLTEVLDTLQNEEERPPLEDQLAAAEDDRDDAVDSRDDGSRSWVRIQFKEYCDWDTVVCPAGGQITLEYVNRGDVSCGNSTIYRIDADGNRVRVHTFNWNIPESAGYVEGNDFRIVNGGEESTVFLIHNDDGEFTLTVESLPGEFEPPSESNPEDFAGGSAGGRDNSSGEFGSFSGPSHESYGTFSDGFSLSNIPAQFCIEGGVQQYIAYFDIPAYNRWWNDMYVQIEVLDVLVPGDFYVGCPSSESDGETIFIEEPGTYEVSLGAIAAPGESLLEFISPEGTGACFSWDCWGLRTRMPEIPYACGDADGNEIVNIADAVYLISYIFGGGSAPDPLVAGDVDCNRIVNIADAVYLISYIFGGGPQPCEACP